MRSAARTTAVGWAVALAACSLPSVGLWSPHGRANTGLFELYGSRIAHGSLPYRSGFAMEYPPGAIPPFAVPALPGGHYVTWFHVFEFACLLLVIFAVSAALEGAGARRRLVAVCLAATAPAALGQISLNSFDLWASALAALGIAATLSAFPRIGFIFLAVAASAKFYPVLLAPALFTYVERAHGRSVARQSLYAGGIAIALVFLPFAVSAPGGLGFSLQEQATRGLQVESLAGSLLGVAHRLGAGFEVTVSTSPFSYDIAGPLAGALATATSVFVVVAAFVVWRALSAGAVDRDRTVCALAATSVAFVAFAKVVSPQYLLFLVPIVPLVPSIAAAALFLVALGLTQVWARFPQPFAQVTSLHGMIWVTLARNLVLVSLFGTLLAELHRSRTASPKRCTTRQARDTSVRQIPPQ